GGNYVLTLMDVYGGGIAVLFIAIAECISLLWIYEPIKTKYEVNPPGIELALQIMVCFSGLRNVCDDVQFMLGKKPNVYWRITWSFFAPVILSVIFIMSLVKFKPLGDDSYDYPDWADAVGFCLGCLSIAQIPICAIFSIFQQKGSSLKNKFLLSTKPTQDWGPSDLDLRESWLEFKRKSHPTLLLNSIEHVNSTTHTVAVPDEETFRCRVVSLKETSSLKLGARNGFMFLSNYYPVLNFEILFNFDIFEKRIEKRT
ncbi:Sodium-dependent nutrient amino acid transporter 1, partial [Zootermopsis nevadensis]